MLGIPLAPMNLKQKSLGTGVSARPQAPLALLSARVLCAALEDPERTWLGLQGMCLRGHGWACLLCSSRQEMLLGHLRPKGRPGGGHRRRQLGACSEGYAGGRPARGTRRGTEPRRGKQRRSRVITKPPVAPHEPPVRRILTGVVSGIYAGCVSDMGCPLKLSEPGKSDPVGRSSAKS